MPPRALNHHKPWLPVAQQFYKLQHFNDVTLTVNRTLAVLANKIPNLHYISHPGFMHADIHKLEESFHHSLIAKDGLQLSFSGCEMVCRNIISVSNRICLRTVAPQSALDPPSAPLLVPQPKFQSIWDDEMSDDGITVPDAYSSVLSRTPIQQPPQMEHIPDIFLSWHFHHFLHLDLHLQQLLDLYLHQLLDLHLQQLLDLHLHQVVDLHLH